MVALVTEIVKMLDLKGTYWLRAIPVLVYLVSMPPKMAVGTYSITLSIHPIRSYIHPV